MPAGTDILSDLIPVPGGASSTDTGDERLRREASVPALFILRRSFGAQALFGALALAVVLRWMPGEWPAMLCQVLLFGALAVAAARSTFRLELGVRTLALAALPVTGLVQLLSRSTASVHDTLVESLYWATLVCVFILARNYSGDRDRILYWVEVFGASAAVLCLVQLSNSQGRVLWLWDTGFPEVYATMPYSNNWAQFGELVLPIALWRALRPGPNWYWHALAAGVVFASIVASASRAGTVLALAEIAAACALCFLSTERWPLRVSAVAGALPVLALLFAWASGLETVVQRFRDAGLFEGRREFLLSAVEMTRARPLTGFGLGTFDRVYPEFALVDFDGRYVNHAHNDWAEFAAEGGLPFLLLALIATLPALTRVRREPWLLGAVALLVHAFVDYPFARLATAGWFFLLAGLALPPPRKASMGHRIPVIALACVALVITCVAAIADFLYRLDTTRSVSTAIALMPHNARYVGRLAELDPPNAPQLLETARRLDPRDARVMIELALRAEAELMPRRAEDLLLAAAKADQTAVPRWTLLNYYARNERPDEFWKWLPRVLSITAGETWAVFDLARRLDPELERTAAQLPARPAVLREFLEYAIEKNQFSHALSPAVALVASGTAARQTPFLLGLINLLIRDHRPDDALAIWNGMAARKWIPIRPAAFMSSMPLQAGFDWRLYFTDGVTPATRGDLLEVTFDGRQKEACVPAEIFLPVQPGKQHRFRYKVQTEGIPPDAGLYWQFIDPQNDRQLTQSASLASANQFKEGAVSFTPDSSLVRIQLLYRRQTGTTRIRGLVRLEDTGLSLN